MKSRLSRLHGNDKSLANLGLFLVVPATAEKAEHLVPLQDTAKVLNTAAGLLGGGDKPVHLVIALKTQAEGEEGHKAVLARLAKARVGGNNGEDMEQLFASVSVNDAAKVWQYFQLYYALKCPAEGPLMVVDLLGMQIPSGNVERIANFVFRDGSKQVENAIPQIAEQLHAAHKGPNAAPKLKGIKRALKTEFSFEGHLSEKLGEINIYVVKPGAAEGAPHHLEKLTRDMDVIEEARTRRWPGGSLPGNSVVGLVIVPIAASEEELTKAFNEKSN